MIHTDEPALKPVIMIFIGNLDRTSGGAQRAIANQLEFSNPERFHYIVCHMFGGGSLKEDFPSHVTVRKLNVANPLDMRIFSQLRKLINTCEVDVVHTQSNIAGFWGRIVSYRCRGGRVKVVSTEQNSHGRYRSLVGLLNGVTLPSSSRIVCVSEAVRDSFFKWEKFILGRAKIDVIHNAVNTARYHGIPRDGNATLRTELGLVTEDLILANVARNDPQKNHEHLIREFETIRERIPQCRLLLIGSGLEGSNLESLIERLECSDQVRIIGPRSDMDAIYRMIDIFVLPSLHEGFSLAVLEAMACGLPIIASDIPQVVEATGNTAVIVSPTRKGELSRAIFEVATDAGLRRRLSDAASARAQLMFNSRDLSHRYEEIYSELVDFSK